ncbi:MAG: aminopeptidase [Anaerolineales bacterium]|jgi:aminopeptidase
MTGSFEQNMQRYADIIVQVGLNLQSGQRLVIEAPVETAPLVRFVAARAYQAGARLVDVIFDDDQVTLARFQFAPRDSFEEDRVWMGRVLEEYGRSGNAFLKIKAEDPDLLKDQDPELVGQYKRSYLKNRKAFNDLISQNVLNWCVVSAPVAGWAAKMFPNLAPDEREERLWQSIFDVCRLNQDDPLEAWKRHIQDLAARRDYLTHKGYSALKYSAPGTDLTVGLPDGHVWRSGNLDSQGGILFTPNLPTEEVFTIPHKDRVDGVVTSTRPLSYATTLIEDFSLTFEAGRVVNLQAARGESILRNLIETDEGTHRLGEVALVPNSSPISQSGLMFYNTLYDENAASHLAVGMAYQFTLRGGEEMSMEEFQAAGGNHSVNHVDFMVGSAQLDVDGICSDGNLEPIMRRGEWAFDL